MTKLKTSGPVADRLSGIAALLGIGAATTLRHAIGRRLIPHWDANLETGVRFTRRQFTRALARIEAGDPVRARALFDAVQLETDDTYAVKTEEGPEGTWYRPLGPCGTGVILYFHGGGYSFHGAMNRRFAALLACRTGRAVYAPDYRLTPEHPHPAQAQDAMLAWTRVTRDTDPTEVVLIGDSAGGHMVLMHLLALRDAGLVQPALAIGLCPWTDIGDRGASLRDNDPFDLVQGWMALRFGAYLDPEGKFGRAALSPIAHDFAGLAPLYLQAGGREVLHDMIRDFARIQSDHGADLRLDVWPDMHHDFQMYDSYHPDGAEAVGQIRMMVDWALGAAPRPASNTRTDYASGRFA